MDNQAFDEALRNVAAEVELPYDSEAWRGITQRLDAYEKSRKVVPMWKRFSASARWAAAAMLAGIALMAAWMLHPGEAPTQPGQTVAVQSPGNPMTLAAKNSLAAGVAVESASAQDARQTASTPFLYNRNRPFVAASPQATAQLNLPPQGSPALPPAKMPEEAQPFLEAQPEAETPVARAEQPAVRYDVAPKDASVWSFRKPVFDINGGYSLGAANTGFALGVSVKKPISSRLGFEAGVAVLSGAHTSYTAVPPVYSTGGPGVAGILADTAYTPVIARLVYLQVSPTLSYRLYKGLSAGGGPDAQRLLGDPGRTASVTASGAETAPQPEWDFGLAVRADYAFSRKLRFGVQYRESVRATASGGREAAGRNYLLLQLGYTLF